MFLAAMTMAAAAAATATVDFLLTCRICRLPEGPTLLGGTANLAGAVVSVKLAASQVPSTNFWLVAAPVAPEKGLGQSVVVALRGATWGLRPTGETGKLREL
jgi:hypothetical protein